jgi:hypothetical protein
VQRHGQVDREVLGGQAADAGDDADRRHGEVPGRDPEVGVQALDGAPQPLVVGQRLAHPHEHDVRQPPGPAGPALRRPGGRPPGPHDLLDDLADGQVAVEAGLPGGAERARHGAAGLGADAHRRPVGVVHEHGLDAGAVGQPPQPLHGVAAVADRRRHLGQRRGQLGGQAGPHGLGQRGQGVEVEALAVEAVPHLLDAVAGLVGEQLGQGGAVGVVAGGHGRNDKVHQRSAACGTKPRWS